MDDFHLRTKENLFTDNDPVIGTHFGCRSVSPGGKSKYRNITDETLKALVHRGGIIGIILAPNLLGGFGFEPFFKHLDYAAKLIGAENVCIGTHGGDLRKSPIYASRM